MYCVGEDHTYKYIWCMNRVHTYAEFADMFLDFWKREARQTSRYTLVYFEILAFWVLWLKTRRRLHVYISRVFMEVQEAREHALKGKSFWFIAFFCIISRGRNWDIEHTDCDFFFEHWDWNAGVQTCIQYIHAVQAAREHAPKGKSFLIINP